jgi:hypothetical protein
MVLSSALLPQASLTTEHGATVNGKNLMTPTRLAGVVNHNLDITDCLKEAIQKCYMEIEQARVSDEPTIIQRGLAAEEIVKLLGSLVDLRWSSVLRAEIDALAGSEGLDLRQRMESSWKNNLITKLVNAEVHMKNFIEALVVVEHITPVVALPNNSQIQSETRFHVSEEKIAANGMNGKQSPRPTESVLLKDTSEPHGANPTVVGHEETNSNPTASVDDESSPQDSKDIPDTPNRTTHRKLKPPKSGRIIPTILTDFDVPRGRGGVINRHPGHQYLLARVCSYRDQYKAAKRGEKEILAKQLVREIQDRKGRFLDYVVETNGSKTWYEIDDEASVKVVQQKLRELPVRVKDKWKSTGGDTDEGSGGHEEGDQAGYRQKLYTHPLAHAATLERKAKGERDAAMMLLSL